MYFCFLSVSCSQWGEELLCHILPPPQCSAHVHGAKWLWNEPCETMSKINNSSFDLFGHSNTKVTNTAIYLYQIKYSLSNNVWLFKKGIMTSSLLSFRSLLRTLMQPNGETCDKQLRPPANNHHSQDLHERHNSLIYLQRVYYIQWQTRREFIIYSGKQGGGATVGGGAHYCEQEEPARATVWM
jgi:hypothetical protein